MIEPRDSLASSSGGGSATEFRHYRRFSHGGGYYPKGYTIHRQHTPHGIVEHLNQGGATQRLPNPTTDPKK